MSKTLRRILIGIILMNGAFLLALLISIPDVSRLRSHYPQPRPLNSSESLELFEKRPKSWVPLSSIALSLRQAIMISEDAAFYQHEGIDWAQLQNALEEGLREGGRLRGASTITQQLAKNLYLSGSRSYIRKFREAIIAWRLEQELEKDRILEIYLNVIEYGEGIYGIRRATQFYFSKHPSELRPKESAFLAMLLPNPEKYSVSFRQEALTSYATKSIQTILKRMMEVHWLSEELYQSEMDTPLVFEKEAIEARSEEALKAATRLGEEDQLLTEDFQAEQLESLGSPEETINEVEIPIPIENEMASDAEFPIESEVLPPVDDGLEAEPQDSAAHGP